MDAYHIQENVHEREEEACWRREIVAIIFWVLTILVVIVLGDKIYTKEVAMFYPLWFPKINVCFLFSWCACISFSDHIFMVMMKRC